MEKRVLIARWLGTETESIPIYDEASVSSARQRVREAGHRSNLTKELVERVALVASELTHNQLSHAKQGYFAVRSIERLGVKGLEVIAADLGAGIQRPSLALKNEQTPTSGSLGAGLGAVVRITDEVEFDNRIEEGFCVIARKFEKRSAPRCCEVAIMGKPYPGEAISGDDGVWFHSESGFVAAVADGLGHGPEARQASNRAIETLSRNRERDTDEILIALNRELSGTRGCAMSIARFNKDSRTMECISLGDVHSHLYTLRDAHFFASTPFILGERGLPKQRVRVEKEAVNPGSVLIMFTDGLKSRTSLKGQLDVLRRLPIAIAEHLLENDSRPDDDALVLVARFLS
jgi:anti-sigma regulatory factor (Ser/Thr protein kinase)/serine/threonine protein phosphatase PrpC